MTLWKLLEKQPRLLICSLKKTLSISILLLEEKDSSPIYLPKLYFQLTESQKKVLEYLEAGNFTTLMELSEKIDSSRAMLYRNIKELEEMGLVEDLKLTDAGKIARL